MSKYQTECVIGVVCVSLCHVSHVTQHCVVSMNVELVFSGFVMFTFFRPFFQVVCVSSVVRFRPLLGYRVRLGSSTDKKDTGRLHVDFAQARDDLYEWECRQRMMAREERHRRRIEEDRLRPPSPPPIVHYSEHECSQLGEKLKGRVHVWCFSRFV